MILTGNLEDPLTDYRDARDEERHVLDSLMEVIDWAGLRGEVSMFSVRGQRALAAVYRNLTETALRLRAHGPVRTVRPRSPGGDGGGTYRR